MEHVVTSDVPQLGLVTGTLSRAAHSVGSFAAVFLCVLYGFAAAHMLTFRSKVESYRDMTLSMYSLLTVRGKCATTAAATMPPVCAPTG